jgi:hypothetical protein
MTFFGGESTPDPPLQIILKFISEFCLIKKISKTHKKSEICTINLLGYIELEKYQKHILLYIVIMIMSVKTIK